MSELCVLDASGDTKFMWSRSNSEEVKAAREHFDMLKKKGYWAYRVEDREGSKGEVVRDFDPSLERIIMAPRPIGG